MDKKFFNGILTGTVIGVVVALGAVTFVQNLGMFGLKDWNKLNRVTSLIENKYYGEYSEEDIITGILQGSCFNLDAYSAYLTLDDYEDAVDADQKFGGIGVNATYNKYTRVYKINYCYDDTPAARAGLKRNDVVEAVDGIDVYDMDLDRMNSLIRGEPGTKVSLKVNRDGELLDFDIIREKIDTPFAYSYRISDDIGFIKITSFTGEADIDFMEAMWSVADCRGVVLDLRDNLGGTIDVYQKIMSLILPPSDFQYIDYVDGSRDVLHCDSGLERPAFKFAVLVNGSTASCAESMALALKDLTDAEIIGEETYGKGVVQEYFQIDKDSVVRLTVGIASSPSGVVWNEVGIVPDQIIENEYSGDDFEESVLLSESQVLAAVNWLEESLASET